MRNTNSVFRRSSMLAFSLCGFALAGCSSPDQVLFVTNTNLGVGFDAANASGHVGYQRQEVYVGPDYPETGGIPPVAAKLKADLSFSAPAVAQYYATGDAALIATKRIQPFTSIDRSDPKKFTDPRDRCALNLGCAPGKGGRRVSVVATNSHVGLEIKAQTGTLSSLDFGYGRQEASVLPLRSDKGEDIYPSSYASIAVETTKGTGGMPGGLAISQFIATGAAADALASTPEVQDSFSAMATAAAAQQKGELAASLNMTSAEFETMRAQGAQAAITRAAKINAALAKLLGRSPADEETLSQEDVKTIRESLSALSLTPAPNPSVADLATGSSYRKYLAIHAAVGTAFIAQQKVGDAP